MQNLSFKVRGGLLGVILIPIIIALVILMFFDYGFVQPLNYLSLFFPGLEFFISLFCWGSCSKFLIVIFSLIVHSVINFFIGYVVGGFIRRRNN